MPSLKDLKNRIASVKPTQKTTKAMQRVAAAKLRRAQDSAVAARTSMRAVSGAGAPSQAPRGSSGLGRPSITSGRFAQGSHGRQAPRSGSMSTAP